MQIGLRDFRGTPINFTSGDKVHEFSQRRRPVFCLLLDKCFGALRPLKPYMGDISLNVEA